MSHLFTWAWERIPQAIIVAIADPDLKRAQICAQESGIDPGRVFTSLSDLLQAEEGLDFMDIAIKDISNESKSFGGSRDF